MANVEMLAELFSVIKERKNAKKNDSYTAKLFHRGREKIAQKLGEEAVETCIEAVLNKRKNTIAESADLLYHLLVLWADMQIEFADVIDELQERKGISGLEEKKNRKGKKAEKKVGYDDANIFAKIIRGEIPCKEVYQDEEVLAFWDIQPAAPVHVLVIPKAKYVSFDDFVKRASPHEISSFFAKVRKIARELDVHKKGYRIITNNGEDASQSVAHFHVHILAGKALGGLLRADTKVR